MYYLATKSELTSIADGIRKVTGESSKISYPFIEAIDNIQILDLDSYDTLIGFTYNSSALTAGNGMENLPESTYITFISDPYASAGGMDAFPFANKEEMYSRFSQIAGITFNRAKSIYSTGYSIQYGYSRIGENIKEVTLPVCETIGPFGLPHIKALYLNLPKVKTILSFGIMGDNLVSISLPECEKIGWYGMAYCGKMSQIFLPNCVFLDSHAFEIWDNLQSISLPVCKTISERTFYSCNSLSFISLPMLEEVPFEGLARMKNLHEVYLERCSRIAEYGFCVSYSPSYDTSQLSVYLNISCMVNLVNINAFPDNTTIYVPESLYNAYISDTNWSPLFSKIISTKNF